MLERNINASFFKKRNKIIKALFLNIDKGFILAVCTGIMGENALNFDIGKLGYLLDDICAFFAIL